jgi:hypothetical protein
MNTVLTITGVLLVIIIIISLIYESNKLNKEYKKHEEELKVGNRYKKMKNFRWVDDNPFNVELIVEIIDIKYNRKNEPFVQYRQIEPEYTGEPFSGKFEEFIDYYELIK